VRLDVQTLGEYPTTVTEVRIIDTQSNSVVWEVNANSEKPQIREIVLKPGINSTVLDAGHSRAYEVRVPKSSATFTLQSGRTYAVEVQGTYGLSTRASFSM
jgi:hypothetical protein